MEAYVTLSMVKSKLELLKGNRITRFNRFGYFSDTYLGNIQTVYGDAGLVRSLSGVVIIELDEEKIYLSKIQKHNSVEVLDIEERVIEEKLKEQTESEFSYKLISLNDQHPGFTGYNKYLNTEVKKCGILKQVGINPRFSRCKNEVGMLLEFSNSARLAIGANLAPHGGYGCVMLIDFEEIDERWCGELQLESLF